VFFHRKYDKKFKLKITSPTGKITNVLRATVNGEIVKAECIRKENSKKYILRVATKVGVYEGIWCGDYYKGKFTTHYTDHDIPFEFLVISSNTPKYHVLTAIQHQPPLFSSKLHPPIRICFLSYQLFPPFHTGGSYPPVNHPRHEQRGGAETPIDFVGNCNQA